MLIYVFLLCMTFKENTIRISQGTVLALALGLGSVGVACVNDDLYGFNRCRCGFLLIFPGFHWFFIEVPVKA